MAVLNIVFHDMAVGDILYLFCPFLLAPDLKGMVTDNEVRHLRGDYISSHPRLVIEEGFPEVARIGTV